MFWPLQSNSEISEVSKNSQIPISGVWVSSSHSSKSGVATKTLPKWMFFNCLVGRCRHLWKAICVSVVFVSWFCLCLLLMCCDLVVFVFCLCMYFVTFVVVVPSIFLQDVRLKFFSFPLNSCWVYLPCVKLIVHPWHSWTMMQGLLTKLFKLSKVTSSLTLLIFFKSTRFLHTRRPKWTFYCVRWCRCMLFIWFWRLTSWKWNMHSKWVTGKVTRFSTCFLQLGEEKRT